MKLDTNSLAQIVGYLKGKSSLLIFEKYANMKYKYENRHFWCRGYYVGTVGKNKKAIAEYIIKQLQEDIGYDLRVQSKEGDLKICFRTPSLKMFNNIRD